jgi:predicted AlkP superfamily phosphohydrolase/phosphomutase
VGAALFTLAVIASLALPLAARGAGVARLPPLTSWTAREALPSGAAPATPSDEPRVTIIALDGASLGYIMPRAAEGRLPHFSRMLDAGAVIDLATAKPTQPDPVWAAIATGMLPPKTGVRSAARYYAPGDRRGIDLLPDHMLAHALVQIGLVRDVNASAAGWSARPLWGILSDAGLTVGIVRWPLTHPAQALNGFVVSDRLHQFTGADAEMRDAVFPADALPLAIEASQGSFVAASDAGSAAGFLVGTPEATALRRDLMYARAARALTAEERPRFLSIRYDGLDVVSHYYLRYIQPPTPRGIPEAARRRYAQVIDRYYAYIDGELGAVLDSMRPGDLVVVISGFGMERLSPAKELLSRVIGDANITGTHERAPDGFLLAYGTSVQRGRLPRGAIADVAPTLLYFFGLPVARDMDGFARSDLFTRDFTSERPITFIPSYR